jgi:hypothetical protein
MQDLMEYEFTHRTTLMRDVAKYVGQGLFIHFGTTPKLGINPTATHGDPAGVYFYPLDWLVAQGKFLEGNQYAVDRPFWTIVRLTATNGVVFSKLNEFELENIAARQNWPDWAAFKASHSVSGKPEGWASLFWMNVTRLNRSLSPNRALRGIPYIYDDGFGIIHGGERAQLLVIDPRAMQVVATGKQSSGNNKLMNDHEHSFVQMLKRFRGEFGGTLFWKRKLPTLSFDHRGAHFDFTWFASSFAAYLKIDARWGRATKQITMTEYNFSQKPMAETEQFFRDFIERIATLAAKKRDLFFTPILTEQQCRDGLAKVIDPSMFEIVTEIDNERHEMTVTATRKVVEDKLELTTMVYVINGDETFGKKGSGTVKWYASVKSQPYTLTAARNWEVEQLPLGIETAFQETITNVAKDSDGSPKFYYEEDHRAFVGFVAKESGIRSLAEDHADEIAAYEAYPQKARLYREIKRVF